MEMLIRTESLTKIFNHRKPDEARAVAEVTIEIGRGEVTALQGPSGSGKTSLLSLIGCMTRPTSGKVVVGGRDVAKLPERFLAEVRRRTFGFIFQQFNLIRDITVLENVLLPLYPARVGFGAMRERAVAILDKLGMEGKAGRKIAGLSGGEQQRVAIARALINDPEVIVADEPTAHLDRPRSHDLLRILAELNGEGKTVIIATHDPLVHENPLVGRVIAMRDGRVEKVAAR